MMGESRAHLSEAGETYLQHLRFAATVGLILIAAGLACILHSLIPGCCKTTASRTVARLSQLFADRRQLQPAMEDMSGALTLAGLIGLSAPATVLMLVLGSSQGLAPVWMVAVLAFSIPAAYLWTNPQLEPVR